MDVELAPDFQTNFKIMFLVFTFGQLQQIMLKNPPEAQMYVTRIDSLTGSFLIIAWCLMFVFIYFHQKKKENLK